MFLETTPDRRGDVEPCSRVFGYERGLGDMLDPVGYREGAGRLEVAPSTSGALASHGELPKTGHYVIVIDGESYYAPTPYSMTVTIT